MRIVNPSAFRRGWNSQTAVQASLEGRVRAILRSIEAGGQAALVEAVQRLDGAMPRPFATGPPGMRRAWDQAPPGLRRGLRVARRSLRAVQAGMRPGDAGTLIPAPGVRIQARWRPLRRVGCYVPGGTSGYPSTALMTAFVARLAGVEEVLIATPPGPDGRPSQAVLAAAHAAGANAVYAMGGAHAIAAFAFGTNQCNRVDKIVGPGNAWVTEAKRQVVGRVGIDGLAGPTELAILADDSTDLALLAADVVAQAEHDAQARTFIVTQSRATAGAARKAIQDEADAHVNRPALARSLDRNTWIVAEASLAKACQLISEAAPEHVQVLTRSAASVARRIRDVGTIFVGPWSPAAIGDYTTGANHVLPTMRTARWASPLGIHDFLRLETRQTLTRQGIRRLGPAAVAIAEAEGFSAHAASVSRRLDR